MLVQCQVILVTVIIDVAGVNHTEKIAIKGAVEADREIGTAELHHRRDTEGTVEVLRPGDFEVAVEVLPGLVTAVEDPDIIDTQKTLADSITVGLIYTHRFRAVMGSFHQGKVPMRKIMYFRLIVDTRYQKQFGIQNST